MTKNMPSDQKRKPLSKKALLEILQEQMGGKRPVSQGELNPDQPTSFEKFQQQIEEERRRNEELRHRLFEYKRQEKLVYSHQEKETQLQIKVVREELAGLAKSVKKLDKEVEIATKLEPVEPGVYHLSFFEKLKIALREMAQRIDESATWLAAFNRRAKRRNYYWAQVRKSGTKFMLSQERYMATQVG